MAQRGYIRITPLDGLFFGKGRPFNMGDDTWTDADLLPQPGVVWGALASQLYYRGANTAQLEAQLKIGPVMVADTTPSSGSVFVPAPLDMLTEDKKYHHHTFFWKYPQKGGNPRFILHRDTNVLLRPQTATEVEMPEQKLISLAYLYEKYPSEISKVKFDFDLIDIKEQIATELKIGIGRDAHTRTASESMLFTIQLSQLSEGTSILVEFDNQSEISLLQKGILKLGGEGKIAAYEVLGLENSFSQSIALLQKKLLSHEEPHYFFKVLALMPLPLDADGLPQVLKHDDYDVLGGFTGKPVLLGGFDYLKKRPKPMRKYAPAGSVWVIGYKKEKRTIADAANALNTDHIPGRLNVLQVFPYLFTE